MALSAKSTKVLVQALASKPASDALLAAIAGRSALSAKFQVVLSDALTSRLASRARTPSAVDEICAAVVSGANLSVSARRRILEMMADQKAGNDLINVIQSVAQSSPTKL